MVGLLGHERRSSSMFIQILMAWTFGSGSVVCGGHYFFPSPNPVWAIVLEDMAGCVGANALCDWYGSSQLFHPVIMHND